MWGNTLIIDRLHSSCKSGRLARKRRGQARPRLGAAPLDARTIHDGEGTKNRIALPTGTTLAPDAILWVEPEWYLRVEAAIEPVLEIFPSDYNEAVKIAFEVGNRHFPLALRGKQNSGAGRQGDGSLDGRLGAPWERRQAVFDPIGNTQLHQHG